MDLQEIMSQQTFAVVGDTINPEKYAAKIKAGLLSQGYTVHAVGKELASLNDLPGPVDIIDLCIRPDRGLALLQENRTPCKCVVLQPGADSPEILDWLETHHLPYLQGCLLVGMQRYPRREQTK